MNNGDLRSGGVLGLETGKIDVSGNDRWRPSVRWLLGPETGTIGVSGNDRWRPSVRWRARSGDRHDQGVQIISRRPDCASRAGTEPGLRKTKGFDYLNTLIAPVSTPRAVFDHQVSIGISSRWQQVLPASLPASCPHRTEICRTDGVSPSYYQNQ